MLNESKDWYLEKSFASFIFPLVSECLLFVHRVLNFLDWNSLNPIGKVAFPRFNSSKSREFQNDIFLDIIIPVGNRLSFIKETLPQNLAYFEKSTKVRFILSIFADREKIAQWVTESFTHEVAEGKLIIVETESNKFNKAKAINQTLQFVTARYVMILDADLRISDSTNFVEGLNLIESGEIRGVSIDFWGVQIFSSETLRDCGGFCICLQNHDSNFTEGVYGDDLDMVCRVLNGPAFHSAKYLLYRKQDSILISTAWGGRLIKFSRERTLELGNGVTHLNEVKAVDRPKGDYENSLFFRRIGTVSEKKEYSILKYFYWQKFSPNCCFEESNTKSF